jgi:hypothetical protein
MTLGKDGRTLMRGGVCTVVFVDRWAVQVEATGLSPEGNRVAYRVTLTKDEIDMLVRVSLSA